MSAGAGGIRAGMAFVELTLRDQKLVNGLARATRNLRAFGSSVDIVANKMLQLGAALAVPFGLAGKAVASFDEELRTGVAILGIAEQDVRALKDTMFDLAATSTFTEKEVASAFAELARGGFDAEKAIATLPNVLNLARASAGDLKLTTKGLIQILNSFEQGVGDTARVTDILATATVKSSQDLEELIEGFKLVAPIANVAGDDVLQTAKNIAILADAGIRGSRAATGLARAYKNLAKDLTQTKVDEFFGELKRETVALTDEAGNLRPVSDIISELAKRTQDLGTGQRLGFFESLFGRGLAASLNLTVDRLATMDDKFGEIDGRSRDLANTINNNLNAALRSIRNAAVRVGEALIEALGVTPEKIIKRMEEMGKAAATFVRENRELVKTLVVGIAKLVAAAVAFKVLATVVTLVANAFAIILFAFGAFSQAAAILLAVTGKLIAGLTFLGGLVLSTGRFFTRFATGIIKDLLTAVAEVRVFITEFATLGPALSKAIKIKTATLVASITAPFKSAFSKASAILSGIIKGPFLTGFIAQLKETAQAASYFFTGVFNAGLRAGASVFRSYFIASIATIKGLAIGVSTAFKTSVIAALAALKPLLVAIALKAAVVAAIAVAGYVAFRNLGAAITEVANSFVSFVSEVVTGFTDIASAAGEVGKEIKDAFEVGGFQTALKVAKSGFMVLAAEIKRALTRVFIDLRRSVDVLFDAVANRIRDVQRYGGAIIDIALSGGRPDQLIGAIAKIRAQTAQWEQEDKEQKEKMLQRQEQYNSQLLDVERNLKTTRQAHQEYVKEVTAVGEAMRETGIRAAEWNQELDAVVARTQELSGLEWTPGNIDAMLEGLFGTTEPTAVVNKELAKVKRLVEQYSLFDITGDIIPRTEAEDKEFKRIEDELDKLELKIGVDEEALEKQRKLIGEFGQLSDAFRGAFNIGSLQARQFGAEIAGEIEERDETVRSIESLQKSLEQANIKRDNLLEQLGKFGY